MSFFVFIIDQVDRLVRLIGKFGSLLILPLIFVTVFDVVTRKFIFLQQRILESPLHNLLSPTKLQELEWHLHAAIFLLTFGFAYLSNAHVRVDLIREALTPRKQMLIELLGLCLLALPYVAVLIYFSWQFVQSSYDQQEMSSAMTGLPYRWIIKSVFLAGVLLLCLSIISTIVRLLIILFPRSGGLAASLAAGGTSLADLHVLAHEPVKRAVEEKMISADALAEQGVALDMGDDNNNKTGRKH